MPIKRNQRRTIPGANAKLQLRSADFNAKQHIASGNSSTQLPDWAYFYHKGHKDRTKITKKSIDDIFAAS